MDIETISMIVGGVYVLYKYISFSFRLTAVETILNTGKVQGMSTIPGQPVSGELKKIDTNYIG